MRVLMVEDELDIAGFMLKALKAEGYSIDHATTGKQAIFWAKTNDYDMVLLDVQLPDMLGYDICAAIRQAKPTIPIVMTTVRSELPDKLEAFEKGADDYLVKPFMLEELFARMNAILRRPQTAPQDVLQVGDITLDNRKHTVSRGSQAVELRVKEFALLEYMMRNPDAVLTRGTLLEHVWDMNIDPFTNTVDVHIRALRKKLNDPKGRLIQTVHGRGYKIAAA